MFEILVEGFSRGTVPKFLLAGYNPQLYDSMGLERQI